MASEDVITWHPADIFSDQPADHKEFALIALNQPLELPSNIYKKLWDNAVYHIAADGGANQVYDKNHKTSFNGNASDPALQNERKAKNYLDIDTIIGDFDSISSSLFKYFENNGTEIIRDGDQYSTDFTKAVRYVKTFEQPVDSERTPPCPHRQKKLDQLKQLPKSLDIICLGGLGGRVDQALSQLHHLYMFQQEPNYSKGKMYLVSSEAITFVLKAGKHKIKIKEEGKLLKLGKHIGILPIKEPSVITTQGLEWDVTDWKTEFGGEMSTSNHAREDWATIETTKDVVFTIDFVLRSLDE
ncbi:7a7dd2e4-1ca6-4f3c-9ef1-8292bf6ac988-CDS [Sclerotinia trifoliorum]|uniref:Thiamine pyrophosphokinase n=1 Tax=Sclerotinia trifoliorum TaxID=28548 RepID=A0A8H2VMY8_9HELO|nr:7a7dd2e4-1ca6-4f3c-9ef1-8292bf6ac988-CDS [Sclerotinia trifoliorum]